MTGRWTGPVRNPGLEAILHAILDSQKTDPSNPAPLVSLMRATVSAAYPDPVQIIPDGSTDPLPGVPEMYCKPSLGDRVLVLLSGTRMLVAAIAQPDQSRRMTVQADSVLITPTAVNAVTTADVVFDVPFDDTPAITVTPSTTVPQNVFASYQNGTTDGFTVYLLRTDNTSPTRVSWTATIA